jgi:hypothetical protein
MAAGTTDARYKRMTVCCAADSGSPRVGGVSFSYGEYLFGRRTGIEYSFQLYRPQLPLLKKDFVFDARRWVFRCRTTKACADFVLNGREVHVSLIRERG